MIADLTDEEKVMYIEWGSKVEEAVKKKAAFEFDDDDDPETRKRKIDALMASIHGKSHGTT